MMAVATIGIIITIASHRAISLSGNKRGVCDLSAITSELLKKAVRKDWKYISVLVAEKERWNRVL